MNRRGFLAGVGAASAWALAARTQPSGWASPALMSMLCRQAEAAAEKISTLISEIENQVGATTQMPWSPSTMDQRRFEMLRLLREVPAIGELAQLDPSGREQIRVSRLPVDGSRGLTDFSQQPKFTEAVANKVYYGPVYFRRQTEPVMTLSVAGAQREIGVSVAEVALAFVQDVITATKVGDHGVAYVVDAQNRVVAHSDIGLVGRTLADLAQVQAARAGTLTGGTQVARDINGREVLLAFAPVARPHLGWLVFVELPAEEAPAFAK
jgi:two-component system NtrC family sensor kinase